jgi:hypothetical protein
MSQYPSGAKFPFSVSQSGGITKAEGSSKVTSDLKALVLCDIRDRLIYKTLGVISYQSVLRNFTDAYAVLFRKFIIEAILRYEPRAAGVTVNLIKGENSSGSYVIAEVAYAFKNTGEFATLSLELKEV